jgi:hypothetical protein
MRAERRTFMERTAVIAVHGDFRSTTSKDGAFARLNLRGIV